MWTRHGIVFAGYFGIISIAAAAGAQDFIIGDVSAVRQADVTQLKTGTIAFSDHTSEGSINSETALITFDDWANKHPAEKKFLALFPAYTEATVDQPGSGHAAKITEKLYIYVAQARFLLDRAPGAVDLTHNVTVPFLEKVDPAIKHKAIAAADIVSFKDDPGAGNDNPDRKWCTGRAASICIASTYQLEGKIPMGIMLVNKLRDSVKKVVDHIDFQSELSALAPADIDQAGLQELTKLDPPILGALEQNI